MTDMHNCWRYGRFHHATKPRTAFYEKNKLVCEKRGMQHAEFQKSYNLIFSVIYHPIYSRVAPLDSEMWVVSC